MKKFISYGNLSKKKKREHDRIKRGTWGDIRPVTRKAENKKAYKRKKTRRWEDENPLAGSFYTKSTFSAFPALWAGLLTKAS